MNWNPDLGPTYADLSPEDYCGAGHATCPTTCRHYQPGPSIDEMADGLRAAVRGYVKDETVQRIGGAA